MVVMAMLLATLTAGIVMMGSVGAVPGAFAVNPALDGTDVNGIVRINWTVSANADFYNVTIDGTKVHNTTTTTYCWDSFNNRTKFYRNSAHTIKIEAYDTSDNVGLNDSITVYVKAPGIGVWEYGNRSVIDEDNGNGRPWMFENHTIHVLNVSTKLLKYGVTIDGDDFEVNASLDWGNEKQYLWYPVYEGDVSTTYNLTWRRMLMIVVVTKTLVVAHHLVVKDG